ncbi:MAG: PHB depolymerase family esterase [Chloroflexota bacterium]
MTRAIIRQAITRRTVTRRAMLALTAGAGIALLSGCRGARASAEVGQSTPAVREPAPPRQQPGAAARTVPPALATPKAAQSGHSVLQLDVGGVTRRYSRYEPASLDPSAPAPLVLVLHGATASGAIAERLYEMDQQADAHGFVVAYPDALGSPTAWNSGPRGFSGHADDVGFIRALIAQESASRPVDPARTFVCGHSSGAMMSYRLASEASDLFPAVGIVAGSIGYQGPNGRAVTIAKPDLPVSVIHFHGTDDPLVPYDGGSKRGEGGVVSVADSIAFWVGVDGCDPTPTGETIGPSTRQTYAGGHDGSEVTLWTIQGGGHGWPKVDGRQNVAVSPAGISATELIWAFFARHPRAGQ